MKSTGTVEGMAEAATVMADMEAAADGDNGEAVVDGINGETVAAMATGDNGVTRAIMEIKEAGQEIKVATKEDNKVKAASQAAQVKAAGKETTSQGNQDTVMARVTEIKETKELKDPMSAPRNTTANASTWPTLDSN